MLKQKSLPFLASFFCIFMQSALFCMQVKYKQLEERKISAAQHTEMTENHDPIFDGTGLPVEAQDLIKEYAFDCSDYLPFCTFYRRSIPRAHDKTIFIDETCLAVGSYYDHYVRVWELKTLKCKWELPHHGTVLAVTRIGNTLITGCSSGILYRWSLITGKPQTALKLFNDTIHTLINHDQNHVIVAASGDENIHILSILTGEITATFSAAKPIICALKFETGIFALNKDGLITRWDLDTHEETSLHGVHNDLDISAICLLQHGSSTSMLLGLDNGTALIWGRQQEVSALKILQGHNEPVFFARQISPTQVETFSRDGTTKLWDIVSEQCINTTHQEFQALQAYEFTKSGNTIIAYTDGVIQRYSPKTCCAEFLETRRGAHARGRHGWTLSHNKCSYQIYEKNRHAQKLLYNVSCATLLKLQLLLEYLNKQIKACPDKPLKLTKQHKDAYEQLPAELKRCFATHYKQHTAASSDCTIL